MSSEPKKPIEEIVEASATARRAAFGSDPKMPNPMRARLHDEISRLEPEPAADSKTSWLQMFWPRLGIAAAMASVIVIGSVMVWRGSQTNSQGRMEVAGRAPAASNALSDIETGERRPVRRTVDEGGTSNAGAPEDVLAKGAAAGAATAPEVNLADNARAKIEPATTPPAVAESDSLGTSKRFAAAAPAPAAPAQVTKGFISKDQTAAGAPVTSGAEMPAPGQTESGASQQFLQSNAGQAFRNNAQTPQQSSVLNTFQVQQEGSDIRVVDADGSTYTGKLEATAPATDAAALKAKQSFAARVADAKSKLLPQSRFRASGYNRSLNKSVVFDGNYIAPAQQQQSEQRQNENRGEGRRSEAKQEAARIIGTARVQGEPPVQVDATEMPSQQNMQK